MTVSGTATRERICTLCGLPGAGKKGRCEACRGVHAPKKPWTVHPSLPFSADLAAQAFVDEHPLGATCEEVAEAMGLTRSRVQQIEDAAFAALRLAARSPVESDRNEAMRTLAELAGVEVTQLRLVEGSR